MGTLLIIIGALLALCLLAGGLLLWRLHALNRRVGSFECAMRHGEHWHAGIATYARNHLDWHRVVSLSLRPSRRWRRGDLMVLRRNLRQLDGRASQVGEVHCVFRDQDLVLAANDQAVDGLVSWLESAPPGPRTERI